MKRGEENTTMEEETDNVGGGRGGERRKRKEERLGRAVSQKTEAVARMSKDMREACRPHVPFAISERVSRRKIWGKATMKGKLTGRPER